MAYFEIGDVGPDYCMVRIRELSESPSAYNYFYVDFLGRSGNGAGEEINNDVIGSSLSYYSDGGGYYRTNWITFYQLTPGTEYRVYVDAVTNDVYKVNYENGNRYATINTWDEEINVPYPNVWVNLNDSGQDMFYVDWEDVGADKYDIFLNGSYYDTAAGSDTWWPIEGLTPNTWYDVTVVAWIGNQRSNYGFQVIAEALTAPRIPIGLGVSNITANSARVSWTHSPGYYEYHIRVLGNAGERYDYYTQNNYYNLTSLVANYQYSVRVRAFNIYEGHSDYTSLTYFATLASVVRPLNWSWEYTIASGQPFYTQSGSTVYIMRAAHWNAFTARINEFRAYKLGPGNAYSFTTALTTHTETQIRNCVNQAIAAINAMGFSQSLVSSGQNVAASTFTTMRNNINSIT